MASPPAPAKMSTHVSSASTTGSAFGDTEGGVYGSKADGGDASGGGADGVGPERLLVPEVGDGGVSSALPPSSSHPLSPFPFLQALAASLS